MKRTVVIGATPNPSRYAFIASKLLLEYDHEIIPLGIKNGEIQGIKILDIRSKPVLQDIDTITLYIGPRHQPEWYDYIISLNPKRIIFNPGTENDEFAEIASAKGIEVANACTLVLLRVGSY
jgi:uncharacterized protein